MLISEITEAAGDAIEQAAGEAARAAILAMLEREAVALREAQWWRNEAELNKAEKMKNSVITGIICLLSGLVVGIFLGN